jgi:hypothetical protein
MAFMECGGNEGLSIFNAILNSPFSFPAICRKKITAAFDGGRLTSDAGVMLLALADRRLGLAEKLADVFPDGRGPSRIVHGVADMIRARVFAIACGYQDGNASGLARAAAGATMRRRPSVPSMPGGWPSPGLGRHHPKGCLGRGSLIEPGACEWPAAAGLTPKSC